MNLLAPLRPVADVMDLAGEVVAALGIVTVDAASRWLPPADSDDHPTLRLVTADSAGPAPRQRGRRPPEGAGIRDGPARGPGTSSRAHSPPRALVRRGARP